jgi:PIN like domain
VDLLPAVAERGWLFLTQDAHIRHRSAEATALRESGLGVFVVITANLTAERTVEILEKARVVIERVAREEAPPFIWRVARDGSVKPLS